MRALSDRTDHLLQTCLGLLKKLVLLPASLWLLYAEFDAPGGDGIPAFRGAYLGEGLSFAYYRGLYGASVSGSRRIPIWRLNRVQREVMGRGGIVLVELNQLLAFLLPSGGWVAPVWIRQETDLASERYRRRRPGIEWGWGRKVRRYSYQCRISRDDGDLRIFYREYCLPYVSQRHGEAASVRGLAELRRALRSGFLLQVWRDSDWVSGVVVSRPARGRVRLLSMGLKAPFSDRLREGALSAAYYFLFRWAQTNGLRVVDLCGSRPHLMDGVYRHKSLWAAEPRLDPWHHTQIVLFLPNDADLPETVTLQLVHRAGALVTIRECLEKGGHQA